MKRGRRWKRIFKKHTCAEKGAPERSVLFRFFSWVEKHGGLPRVIWLLLWFSTYHTVNRNSENIWRKFTVWPKDINIRIRLFDGKMLVERGLPIWLKRWKRMTWIHRKEYYFCKWKKRSAHFLKRMRGWTAVYTVYSILFCWWTIDQSWWFRNFIRVWAGIWKIDIMSAEIGLYEKYGFEKFGDCNIRIAVCSVKNFMGYAVL